MKAKRIGIIGNGNVGSALARGLERSGHEVRTVGNEEAGIRTAASWADVIVLAVPFTALDSVSDLIHESTEGKTVVDVTNALDNDMNLALGYSTSGAEELQKGMPSARIVKAFNTVFAEHMDTGSLNGETLSTFVSGDDAEARETVLDLASDIGFDAIDAGPLQNARLLEPLGYFNIQLGYVLGLGSSIGFKLYHDDAGNV